MGNPTNMDELGVPPLNKHLWAVGVSGRQELDLDR